MVVAMVESTFTPDWRDRDGAIAGYVRHNEHVRATVPADRLVDTGRGTAGSRSAKRSASRYRQSPSHIRIRRPTSARRAVSIEAHRGTIR